RHADAARAQKNPALGGAARNLLGHATAEVGIIDGVAALRANVLDLDTARAEFLDEKIFECDAAVVASYDDHRDTASGAGAGEVRRLLSPIKENRRRMARGHSKPLRSPSEARAGIRRVPVRAFKNLLVGVDVGNDVLNGFDLLRVFVGDLHLVFFF